MKAKLLIIEDEPQFADYLVRGLTYEGYHVQLGVSAEKGFEIMRSAQADLVILDVMLPGMDGMQACRQLRKTGYSGPIIIITARHALNDRVDGLDAGADDYLVKPFAFDELLARLRALLRRSDTTDSAILFEDIVLDTGLRSVHRAGKMIALTRTEYDLLAMFLASPRQVLDRELIMQEVWGFESSVVSNVLDVYISRLRRKLGNPTLIHTLFGVGYMLKEC